MKPTDLIEVTEKEMDIGQFIYVKSYINVVKIHTESIWCTIVTKKGELVISVIAGSLQAFVSSYH